MITASDILTKAYALLGRPSQADLPYQDMLDRAGEAISGRLLDMKLSARSHTPTIGSWTTPSAREMSALSLTGGASNIIPVKMEWRVAGDTAAMPMPVELVAYEQITALYLAAPTYAAFYNGFSEIAFSETAETLANREYRLTYESMESADFSALASTADLPNIFTTLCAYETAVLCLDQVINETDAWAEKRERLKQSLIPEMLRWDERFKKWQTSRYGNKKVTKNGGRRMTRCR